MMRSKQLMEGILPDRIRWRIREKSVFTKPNFILCQIWFIEKITFKQEKTEQNKV
jgi:hypothetical protein